MTVSAPDDTRKSGLDPFGATTLVAFAGLLALNQVVVKVTGDGFGPVFMAGLRSAGAVAVLLVWMRWRGVALVPARAAWWGGLLTGLLFAAEFTMLFKALDLTTVSRASIIFYSMPVWLAAAAHFTLPGERLNTPRAAGLLSAMVGVAIAMADRSGGEASLPGDVMALLAAMCWAGIALTVRLTGLSRACPEQQLLCQLVVSAPILLIAALVGGDLLRAPGALHLAGLLFQIVCIASLGFLLWFWLMSVYPAGAVASFSFLSPVLAVFFGWLLLGETPGPGIWVALVLVAVGLVLINRR